MPMMIVNGLLAAVAALQAWRQGASVSNPIPPIPTTVLSPGVRGF
jgi:hypothetical protein